MVDAADAYRLTDRWLALDSVAQSALKTGSNVAATQPKAASLRKNQGKHSRWRPVRTG